MPPRITNCGALQPIRDGPSSNQRPTQAVNCNDLLGLFPNWWSSPRSAEGFYSSIWLISHLLCKTYSLGVSSLEYQNDLLNTRLHLLVFNLFPHLKDMNVCRILAICDLIEQKQD